MSAEIVNLNQYRKARQKHDKAEEAVENRRKHGRTKAERKADKKAHDDAEIGLDGRQFVDNADDDTSETPA